MKILSQVSRPLSAFANRCSAAPAGSQGFTLIELMIAVSIVAILAAIAYPAYTDSVLKGKRSQGRAALLDLMQQQERLLTQSGSYMTFAAGATGNNGTVYQVLGGQLIPFKTYSGDSGATSAAYLLGAGLCPGLAFARNECVQVFATPNFSDHAAGTLMLQSTGVKSCDGTTPSLCW